MIELTIKDLHDLINKKCKKYAIAVPKETAPGSKDYKVGGGFVIKVHTLKNPIKWTPEIIRPAVSTEGYKGDKLVYNEQNDSFFCFTSDYWENESQLRKNPILK